MPNADRLPPANIEAEQAVLGSLLLDRAAIAAIADFLKAEDFYREAHRTIYQAALDLFGRREPADFVLMCNELERCARLEQVGGPAYLTSLINMVPSAINVEHYGHIVERTARLRRLISAAGQIATAAYENESNPESACEEAERILLAATERRGLDDPVSLAETLSAYVDQLDSTTDAVTTANGLSTGFPKLDALTGGWQRSDFIVVAARPGMGKTSFALNTAVRAAERATVVIFSLEMTRLQLAERLLASQSGVESSRLRAGKLGDADFEAIIQAAGKLAEAPIYIDDSPTLTLSALRTKARRLHLRSPLGFVVVDYLQLLEGRAAGRDGRAQVVAEVSRGLKGLARELNVPLLACAQLNRAVEQGGGRKPRLSDLRESGQIEMDADVVAFLHRDEDADDLDPKKRGLTELLVAKQRNGPTGTIDLVFRAGHTSFGEHAKHFSTPGTDRAGLWGRNE